MDLRNEGRSERKHRAIVEAATTAFLSKGYLGTNMDEIMFRLGQKGSDAIVISTDQSRAQTSVFGNVGWCLIHGKVTMLPALPASGNWDADAAILEAQVARLKGCWKNNLYGDGHAESIRGDQMKGRWGVSQVYGW